MNKDYIILSLPLDTKLQPLIDIWLEVYNTVSIQKGYNENRELEYWIKLDNGKVD